MEDVRKRIVTALEEFWDERAIPAGPDEGGTVDDLVGPVESMTAVDVLVALDEIVGFKLPSSVIQAGGYQTRDEFLQELTARVMAKVKEGP